ncbi:MAG TPA: hypothetical protein P5572_06250, partial [Phycisphaerae bacterium]|nr:hypothetical protein [Phycisphaerae bacterium]
SGSFTPNPPNGAVGGGTKRINGAGANSPAGFPQFLFSENFFGSAQRSVAPLERLSFDYRVTGSPTNASHDLHFQLGDYNDSNNAVIVRWTSTVSDLGTNGAVPGNIWLIVGDGTGNDTVLVDTGVAVDNNAHRMAIELYPASQTVTVKQDGVAIASNQPTFENVLRLDEFGAGSRTFIAPAGSGTMDLELDNFQWCAAGGDVDCSIYKLPDGTPSDDCDSNGICDVFELTNRDRDHNNQLDVCQGYCNDCNHNSLDDSYEIAQGSLVDTSPANGVPDVCEPATGYNYDFSNFNTGDVSGQLGWWAFTGVNAVGEIRNDNTMGTNSKYLVVKSRSTTSVGTGFVLGPRQASLTDADIELWSWKMRVNDPSNTNDWGRVFVEILDMCDDPPANPNLISDIIASRNVGLEVTRLNSNEGSGTVLAGGASNVYVLGTPSGVPQYELANPIQISNVTANIHNNTWAAGLRINNNSGSGQQGGALWAQLQTDITLPTPGATAKQIGSATTGETTSQITDLAGALRWRGGDRQLWIRTDGNYGVNDDIEFLFDDFKYSTYTDCDGDNIVDSVFLASNPNHDQNGDMIPDRCQDCDNNCPPFPLANNDPCLDPNSLAGNDCNGNLIPDNCDVDPNLPGQRLALREYYAGGGSCDFNSNGVPDECEAGFADCNGNGCNDANELASAGFGGTATDVDNNGVLDECQADCNHNNVPDSRDLSLGVASGGSQDADEFAGPLTNDGKPDECCIDGPGGVVIAANGDMDHDGDRDAKDFQLIQRCAGQTPPACPDSGCVDGAGTVRGSATGGINWDGLQCGCADFNGDGKVDTCDLEVFQSLITGP